MRAHTHGVSLSYRKECSFAICNNMNENRGHYAERKKSDGGGKISYDLTRVWNLKNKTVSNTEPDPSIQRSRWLSKGRGDGRMGDFFKTRKRKERERYIIHYSAAFNLKLTCIYPSCLRTWHQGCKGGRIFTGTLAPARCSEIFRR